MAKIEYTTPCIGLSLSLSLSPACLRVHIPLSQIAEIFSTAITVEEEMCKCVENVQDEKYRSDDIHTQIRNI